MEPGIADPAEGALETIRNQNGFSERVAGFSPQLIETGVRVVELEAPMPRLG